MDAKTSICRVAQAALGEKMMSGRMRSVVHEGSQFVAVESSRRGYRVRRAGDKVIIKRIDPWATAMGLPPLYYFHARVNEQDGKTIDGQIGMRSLPKYFLVAWFMIVLITMLGSLLWALFLASGFMIAAVVPVGEELASAGLLIGSSLGLGIFGILILVVVRAASRRQKRKLILFCREYFTPTVHN